MEEIDDDIEIENDELINEQDSDVSGDELRGMTVQDMENQK